MCGTITNVLSVALYTIIISFIIPESIVTIVYVIILRKVRQSIRDLRTAPDPSETRTQTRTRPGLGPKSNKLSGPGLGPGSKIYILSGPGPGLGLYIVSTDTRRASIYLFRTQ